MSLSALHAGGSKIIKDGYDISCFLQNIDVQTNIDELETTSLCVENGKTFIQGTEGTTLSGDGFWDGGTDAIDEILEASKRATANIWTIFPNNNDVGNRGVGISGIRTSYTVNTVVSDLVKISVAGRSNVERESLLCLQPLTALTSTTYSTPQDHGSQTTEGCSIYIQITDVTGEINFDIEDSPDNITYSAIKAVALDAVGGYRYEVTGDIERYVRVTTTIGGGESVTAQVSICRK